MHSRPQPSAYTMRLPAGPAAVTGRAIPGNSSTQRPSALPRTSTRLIYVCSRAPTTRPAPKSARYSKPRSRSSASRSREPSSHGGAFSAGIRGDPDQRADAGGGQFGLGEKSDRSTVRGRFPVPVTVTPCS